MSKKKEDKPELELHIFDFDGVILKPKAKTKLEKARSKKQNDSLQTIGKKYLHNQVLRVLDELSSSVDIVILTNRHISLAKETLDLLYSDFFPRVGIYTRRAFVSFRTAKEADSEEKVNRIITCANMYRSTNGGVMLPTHVTLYEDSDSVIEKLKRARKKHQILPDNFSVYQPNFDSSGKPVAPTKHKV